MSPKVINGIYKIFGNQKKEETAQSLTVKWSQETAQIGDTVEITGKLTGNVGRQRVLVLILFNGNKFAEARNIVVHGDTITALWDVKSFNRGEFTSGAYKAEIQYGDLSGTTRIPLIIERPGGNQYASTFVRAAQPKGPNLKGFKE
jgi:hypothetical protein